MATNINQQPTGWIIAGNQTRYRVGGSLYLNSGVARPDYRITCKLFRIDVVSGSPIAAVLIGTFYGIPSISKKYTVSSVDYYFVDFDLQDAILADMQSVEPSIPSTHSRTSANFFRTYKCDFNEYFDGASINLAVSSTIAAVPAGQPRLRSYDAPSFVSNYLTAATEQRFLNTHRPNGRMLFNQFLLLNYYNTYTSGFINLNAKVYYHYGTDKLFVEYFMFALPNPGANFLTWAINLSAISWATFFGDPFFGVDLAEPFNAEGIYKIEFSVTNPSTRVSEVLSFEVVHPRIVPHAKAFYFVNSMGFWECMVTKGKAASKDKYLSAEADLYVDNSNTSTTKMVQGNLSQYNGKIEQEITQALGYTNAVMFEQFKDFLRSNRRVLRIGGYYYPIVITQTDFEGIADDMKLFGRSFTYKPASQEEYYQ